MYTYENHLLVRTEHQEPGSSRDGMVETRTYYPSGKQESATQIFADDTGHTTVYDEHDRQIGMIHHIGNAIAESYRPFSTARNAESDGRLSSLCVQRTQEKVSLQSNGIHAN